MQLITIDLFVFSLSKLKSYHHFLSLGSRPSSECNHPADLSIPSSCSSFALSATSSATVDPSSCDAFHSLPVHPLSSVSIVTPQLRSRSQNDQSALLLSTYYSNHLQHRPCDLTPLPATSGTHLYTIDPHMPALSSASCLSRSNVDHGTTHRSRSPAADSFTTDPGNRSLNGTFQSRVPSYVGISCAISGYRSFNHNLQASSTITDTRTALYDRKPLLTTVSSYFNRPKSSIPLDSNRFQKMAVDTDKLQSKPSVDVEPSTNGFSLLLDFSPNLHPHDSSNGSNCLMPNDEYDDEDQPKSLVQSRIESLYGSQFANVWRTNRGKNKLGQAEQDSFRSPSCPPDIITNLACNSKFCGKNKFEHLILNIFVFVNRKFARLSTYRCDNECFVRGQRRFRVKFGQRAPKTG